MKTFKRICIKTHTIADQNENIMTVERGKEYLTSSQKDDQVMVFSKYWCWFPSNIFAGEEVFTKT